MQVHSPRQAVLVPRQAGLVSSQGGAQALQVLTPRQVAQAVQALSPRQAALVPRQAGFMYSQEGVQAAHVLSPRQVVLAPRQAMLVAHSREGVHKIQAFLPSKLESQSQPRCLWCYSGMLLLPLTIHQVSLGNKSRDLKGWCLAL